MNALAFLALIDPLPTVEMTAGETILMEGMRTASLFFLVEGAVVVTKAGTTVAEVADPGAVFGEMAVLLGVESTATVTTVTPCIFKRADNMGEFLKEYPEVCDYIATILAQRLQKMNDYLVDLKQQFGDRDDHLGMIDTCLAQMMNKHPRAIQRAPRECDLVED